MGERDSDRHVVYTSYAYHSTRPLVNYVDKEHAQLMNSAGHEMTEQDREILEKRSEVYNFERHLVISPDDNDYTVDEMGEATRRSMNTYFSDAETVDYAYAVHTDEDSIHSHVVMAGDIDDVSMYENEEEQDLSEFQEQSLEQFEQVRDQNQKDLEQDLQRENDLEQQQEQEQQQERTI